MATGIQAGDDECTTGLSGKMFAHWTANPTLCPTGAFSPAAEPGVKALCWTIAQAVAEQVNEDLGL